MTAKGALRREVAKVTAAKPTCHRVCHSFFRFRLSHQQELNISPRSRHIMGAYQLVAATVLLLIVLAGEGFALECVVCNSIQQQNCDVSPLDYLETCNASATSCRKMEQEIYYEGDYHVRTIRQCAYESGPLKCIERTGTYRFKVFYCHCDKDECNGAETLSLSLILAGLSAAVALLFKL